MDATALFLFLFCFCHLSLGVKDIVKTESFLQRHQFHQRLLVITGASWEQLGKDNDWLEQWSWGATQRTRPLHDGKEQQRKQMLPQRTQRRGERGRETADVSLPLSPSHSEELALYSAGKKRQQPYLLLTKWCNWAQHDGQTFVLLCYGQVSLCLSKDFSLIL